MSFCTISYSCFKSYYYQIIKVDMDSKKNYIFKFNQFPPQKIEIKF